MKQQTQTKILGLTLIMLTLSMQAQLKERIKSHTAYLSSDELEGRGQGSKGIELAAAYIAKQFKNNGLKPHNGNSFYQKFSVPESIGLETNIIGYLDAAEPSDKSIVFTAHYDAYGIRKEPGQQDSIYNGARDNAVGVSALIELARTFANEKTPRHNIVFVATAAEEFGRHGSKYYVNNPLLPSNEIIICLNIDGLNVSGIRTDYFILPRQGIDFIDKVESILRPSGWHYNSPNWVDGLNKNFDTASFLSNGIPAVTIWVGDRLKDGSFAKPLPFGPIHTPDDEINKYWNWNGVEEHLQLYKTIADYFLENPNGIRVTNPKLFTED